MELRVHFPSAGTPFGWTCAGPARGPRSVSPYGHRSCCRENTARIHPSLGSHNLSASSSPWIPHPREEEGKDLMEISCLGLGAPKSLTLSTLSSCGSVLTPIYCKKKLLWFGLIEALTHPPSPLFYLNYTPTSSPKLWLVFFLKCAVLAFLTNSSSELN